MVSMVMDILKDIDSKDYVPSYWKYIAFFALGILVSATPTHFFELHGKPDRKEVLEMISSMAPVALSAEIKQIIEVQNDIKIEQAKINTALENVLYELKRDNK